MIQSQEIKELKFRFHLNENVCQFRSHFEYVIVDVWKVLQCIDEFFNL